MDFKWGNVLFWTVAGFVTIWAYGQIIGALSLVVGAASAAAQGVLGALVP